MALSDADRSAGIAGGYFVSAILVVVLALYFGTVLSFYDLYSEQGSDQSHAPLLLLVSLYLVYRAWIEGGRHLRVRLNPAATASLALLSLMWLVSGLVVVEAGQQASFIVMLALLPVSLFGLGAGSRYLVPILILLTLVPVWPVFIPYLQTLSAAASAHVLDLAGITSTREGYLLIIPNGTFEVADACSGLKFQTVGITLALIHTQLTKVPWRITALYLLAASLLALLTNVIRICVVVAIGYYYGMDHEYVQDHDFIGWSLFALLFFLFLYAGERQLVKHRNPVSLEAAEAPARLSLRRQLLGSLLVILAFALGPLLHGYFTGTARGDVDDWITPRGSLLGWSPISEALSEWRPLWSRGDVTYQGRFRSTEGEVDLYATQFHTQSQGREAVNVSHRVYDIDKWSRISRSAKVIRLAGHAPLSVEETLLRGPGYKQRLVWSWYRTYAKDVPTNTEAKWNNLLGVLSGNPDIAVFILSMEVTKDEEHTTEVLADFVNQYLSVIGGRS